MSFRTANFRKALGGGWIFTWGTRTYMAWRNEAGFHGRQWELFEQRGSDDWTPVADMLPTRQACVDAAAKSRGQSIQEVTE